MTHSRKWLVVEYIVMTTKKAIDHDVYQDKLRKRPREQKQSHPNMMMM
jgi:hypothetical protein